MSATVIVLAILRRETNQCNIVVIQAHFGFNSSVRAIEKQSV